MKILNSHEIRIAEGLVQKHTPKSFKMYGLLFGLNRTPGRDLEIVVDRWPDFNVIVCRPQAKDKDNDDALYAKRVSLFCTDEQMLWNMLTEYDVIDWRACFMFAGVDISHTSVLEEISSKNGARFRPLVHVHLFHLPDCDSLLSYEHSDVDLNVSSLNDSHVELVNRTWKFGGNEHGYRTIKRLIANFPTCCILDDHGQPVSWILVYDYCAMGMLYTLPAHRGKGYAKVIVSRMARKLHAQGFPVYGFVEVENVVSYRLFKNLGFIEDPAYRASWYECN